MKIRIIVLSFILAFSFCTLPALAIDSDELSFHQEEIKFDQNKNLTEEEVNERFQLINSTYDVGEPFNETDTEFVKLYPGIHNASSPNLRVTEKGYDVFKTGSGVTVNLYGTMYADITPLNGWYRSDASLNINNGYTNVTGLTLHITCEAYGLLGSSGTYVGIVYSGDKTTKLTPGSKSYYVDKRYEFNGIGIISAYANTYIDVDTKTGGFNLYAF